MKHKRLSERARARDIRRTRLTAGVTALAVLAYFGQALLFRSEGLDPNTLCLANAPLQSSTVVLVDASDRFNPAQLRLVNSAIADVRDSLPKSAKLTLLFLDADNGYEARELVSLCNPGVGRAANMIYETPKRVQKRWDEDFGAPLSAAIAGLESAPEASRSPIMQAIAGATWRPDFDLSVPHRQFVLISDLLQHEPGDFSAYVQANLERRFENSRVARDALAELDGADVRIELIRRPGAIGFQSGELKDFWQQWFLDRGAARVTFGKPVDKAPTQGGPRLALEP